MLVLQRSVGQVIRVGDDIKIKLMAAPGARRVRIGIEAPLSVSIYREEIYERIQKEQAEKQEAQP